MRQFVLANYDDIVVLVRRVSIVMSICWIYLVWFLVCKMVYGRVFYFKIVPNILWIFYCVPSMTSKCDREIWINEW